MSERAADNRRVLVIDDNESIHRDFRWILAGPAGAGGGAPASGLEAELFGDVDGDPGTGSGGPGGEGGEAFEVECESSGEAGHARCLAARRAGRPYAVAFVDMRMPGWDGLRTIGRLLADDPEVQVVLCTAYSDHPWDEVRRAVGGTDRLLVLKKPFDAVEAVQMACSLARKWDLARRARARAEGLEDLVRQRTRDLERLNDSLRAEIVQRQAVEEQVRHSAFHDALTDLPNRTMLLERLGRCVEPGWPSAFALLYLDLDGFKYVNDNLGHRVGDELLVAAARRLTACVRSRGGGSTLVARLGGDEFVVLLEGTGDAASAVSVAERVRLALAEPFDLAGRTVIVGCSVGIALRDARYRAAEDVLRDADLAMYEAKRSGKGRTVAFDQNMQCRAMRRFDLEMELRRAVRQGELAAAYQPIVSLRTGQLYAFEALLRWRHPTRGMVPPADFVPIAEETGLIAAAGEQVLRQACHQLARWSARFPAARAAGVAVNVSPVQFADDALAGVVEAALRDAGLEPRRLHVEITEGVLFDPRGPSVRNLARLRELGVSLALDDFGTGYSSLSCLNTLPLGILKLDRSFVSRLGPQDDGAATIGAIVQLARHKGLATIAEGVETPDQLVQLQAMDCDYAQGYLIARPEMPDVVERVLEAGDAWLADVRRRLDAA